jgi:hypothetical protein
LAEYRIRGTFEVVSNGAGVELGPPTRRALAAILPLNAVLGAHPAVGVPVDAHRLGCETGGSWHRARSGGPGCG